VTDFRIFDSRYVTSAIVITPEEVLKVAWVSVYDAEDPHAYGGRGYYAPMSLQNQSVAMEYIGPFKMPLSLKVLRKLRIARHRLFHENSFIRPNDRRWISRDNLPIVHESYASQISRKLSRLNDVDVVCSGVNPCVPPLSYLECKQPIVIWTDTTIASAIDFYPRYFRNCICSESIHDILSIEKSLMQRCKLAIFSSEWGARSAVEFYGIDPSKLKVVPFGANLRCPRTRTDIEVLAGSRPRNRCKLLFIGVDWLRKGGDIAMRVASELNRSGLPTELTVVGCDPICDGPLPDFVRPLGYISNATEEGANRLNSLIAESHFFIMPSRAETYGHVFCEASSFGVPSIASDVGGIPAAVRNDVNGKTFSKDAPVQAYCSYITDLFADYPRYLNLALSSFREYKERLNWDVAGRTVRTMLESVVTH
jgi:glycosyltransferase involved in cell wall biosynthesis